MFKKFTVSAALLLLVVFATMSLATETRVISMGGVGPFIRDNSNIFYFPATINQYANQAVAELRLKESRVDNSIGIHLPIMSGSVLGIYLNQPVEMPVDYTNITPHLELKNAITAIYGTKLSSFDLGILFTMISDGWENGATDPKTEESARLMNIGVGISAPNYDLGVQFGLPSFSYTADPVENKFGGFGLDIMGRYFMKRSESLEIVPLVRFGTGSGTYEADSGIQGVDKNETDLSALDLQLAVGLNYALNENNLALLGLELFGLSSESQEVKDSYKITEKTTVMPAFFVGIESTLRPWLIGRLGATQTYFENTSKYEPDEGEDSETSSSDSDFGLSFGFGIKVGGFLLDAHFNENLFFDGPNFISGQTNSIAHRISVTYNF